MIGLYLNNRKQLSASVDSLNFEGENSFEKVKIVSDKKICGHSIEDCTVECHIITPGGEGDIVLLEFADRELPTAEFLFDGRYTSQDGEIIIFLKIFSDDEVIGLTNEVKVNIFRHKAVTKYISDYNLTLLDQYSEALQKAVEIIEEGLDEIVGISVENYLSTHPMVDELTREDIMVLF